VPALRKARALSPGATIGIAAPAFAVDAEAVEVGEAQLRDAGFDTARRDDLTACSGYLAGDDRRRACELMDLIDDAGVDAIICARGGYGCHRIIADLDPLRVRAAAKPLLGFSDITTLLLWQWKQAGLVGLHAPMLEKREGMLPAELASLLRTLGGELPPVLKGQPRGRGRGEGPLIGGSLTLLAASLGTPWELDTRGAILLFEEVAEKPYALDRMLHQLGAAGKLDALAGVGVGHLVECVDPKRATPSAEDVVLEALAPLGIPIVLGLPFGHGRPNLTWPFGVRGALDGERGELEVLEPGVERR
jgi:muramoyltetrapeptide carboxypeptidase